MKTATYGAVAMLALMLGAATLKAATVVSTLGGGPLYDLTTYYGYNDGNTKLDAQFNTPCGLAIDISGQYLLLADKGNNLIRVNDLLAGDTYTYANDTSLMNAPIGVAIDSDYNVFVLNYGNGSNGSIYEFDSFGDTIATNAVNLPNVGGITLDNADNIYVTVSNNTVICITSTNTITVATITNAGTSLQGIILKKAGATAGMIAACDSGRNGIYLINPTNGVVTTNAGFHGVGDFSPAGTDAAAKTTARFNQPMSLAEASDGSLIVADYGNNRVKVVNASDGSVNNFYGVPSSYWVQGSPPVYPGWYDGTVIIPDRPPAQGGDVEARQPYGLVLAPNGTLYVTENYYDIIRSVTGSGLVPPPLPATTPTGLSATVSFGQVSLTWTASSGATSYNVKRSTISGDETTIANVSGTSYTDTGLLNGTTYYYVVSAVGPGGESANSSEWIATLPTLLPPTGLSATTNFNLVKLTWSASPGASSYNVKRSTSTGSETTIASSTTTTYSDTTVLNGSTYYYVVSAVNAGGESANSLEISTTVPIPPPPPPTIGWYDFEGNTATGFYSTIHAVSPGNPYIANNPLLIAIDPTTNGVSTRYIPIPPYTNNTPASIVINNGSVPPVYKNNQLQGSPLVNPLPQDLFNGMALSNGIVTIEAVNVNGIGEASPVTSASFLFQAGTPTITGNNAALFTLSDITTNVVYYYTLDGTDPTNAPASQQVVSTNGTVSLSLNGNTNIFFQVRAFGAPGTPEAGYAVSGTAQQDFVPGSFVPNTISFGFASGEASSAFIATPGETNYIPVTLTTVPGTVIDSMQFNVSVNSTNPGSPITPGAFNFLSMLEQPNPTNPTVYETITNFEFVDPSENLISVGWLERAGQTNLYNSLSQDLIAFSQAHDDLFPGPQQPNGVILGGFSFYVPLNATPGQTYQIQITRPSATTDGIGDPGSGVFIYAPTNTNPSALGAGSLNAIKNVIVGSAQYIVGDSAPFRWFNAGDFGNTNLDNADVEQVFEAAAYGLNAPPPGSDFFDCMDSAGAFGIVGPGGYYTPAPGGVFSDIAGDDALAINQINNEVFGDSILDISDVYVTFRRSLDTNLVWYARFHTNDVVNGYPVPGGTSIAAIQIPNVFNPTPSSLAKSLSSPVVGPVSITNTPSVNFASTDYLASAGQVLQIPITANVFGSYSLRVLMLNISVVPLDGSPALTTPVSFTLNPPFNNTANYNNPNTLGLQRSTGNGNYSVALLPVQFPIPQSLGISNSGVIGTLTVKIPTNATSMSSYAIHFDHASGSPGIGSFPRHTLTGLITLSSRTNSTYNDGIPDSWRLRWFGTVNNLLSVSNADADGAGFNNWYKYVAGLDPTDPKSKLTAGTDQSMAQSPQDSVIYWPSVAGKQYVIQRSSSLFPGTWSALSTNTGTGGNMEIHDASGGNSRFYRVSVH
jgi:hypothetical protein